MIVIIKQLFKKYLSKLTDDELKILLDEIHEYTNTGVLYSHSRVRKVRKEVITTLEELMDDDYKNFDIDCRQITIPEIYEEISRRYFDIISK